MTSTQLLQTALLASILITVGGCGQSDGPAERAGERIDEAVEQTKDQVGDAVDRAGEQIEQAGDAIREKTEQ